MSNFLRADFYKVKNTNWLWILPLAVFIVIVALYGLTKVAIGSLNYGEIPEGYESEILNNYSMLGTGLLFSTPVSIDLYICFAIAAALFIGSEFNSGAVRLYAARGKSRVGLYASKMIVLACIVVAYTLFSYLISAICSAVFFDYDGFTAYDNLLLLRSIVLTCWINISITSIFVMLAYLIRNTGGSIGAAIGLVIFAELIVTASSITPEGHWIREAIKYMPSALLSFSSTTASYGIADVMQLVFVPFAYIALSAFIGLSTFINRDIK